MKKIVILGSTGSIGRQTLDVIRNLPDKFMVTGLAAGKNWRLLAEQVKEFQPSYAVLSGPRELDLLKSELRSGKIPELGWGREGLESLASMSEADLVVVAVTGSAGIFPTIAALGSGKNIALANKETLVAAGQLVMDLSSQKKANIYPVDSEHSALWQCLNGNNQDEVEKIILTASGGPFRELNSAELKNVTVEMALRHPNWNMGKKVTIDSATLMNKGLEVIEAKWLFGVNYSQIEVLVHPQSIIHSAVEFIDGSIIAQMGAPDMRLPIQYALTYPERMSGLAPRLKMAELKGLTFETPDIGRFPSLRLAFEAGQTGGTMPAVLNASNEVAVDAFLKGALSFTGIPLIVEGVMCKHNTIRTTTLEGIMEADLWARKTAEKIIKNQL
ncbi:MAG: 1-deoxy-D-xylulose-5-phosphate reductoisomerase [Desulfotomaculaceae bacterium]|nr:1-deoxy-D-xylulose-5-phosphate reductoisomerase [Desulfotomaculaceae bacterium]MDD4766012.1 1-deoxy-D-xylulose-5-phosphate reductoisomerase [Desulfotomaculaceae bacterium]